MLMSGMEELEAARSSGRALGAFSVYNMETVQAVVAAAEGTGLPVMIQAGSSAFGHAGREPLARLALDAAEAAAVPVGVHLDHCRDLDELAACVELGYSSVMFDGSDLPLERNAELTARAVEIARARGVVVEGELGAVAGDEDRSSSATAGTMTDPGEAAWFARETGVDLLAVAVGNVHGFAPPGSRIDLERLARIADECPASLVLHGASGVEPEVMLGAVRAGVVKFNVNTELRRAFFEALDRRLPGDRDGYALATLLDGARSAVAAAAAEVAALLAGGGRGESS